MPSPRNFVSPGMNGGSGGSGGAGSGSGGGGPKPMMLADGFQRPREEEYMVSPMNSIAPYISPAASDRHAEHYPQPASGMSRGPLSAPMSSFQRGGQDPYATAREPYAPYGPPIRQHERFPSNPEPMGHPGMPHSAGGVEYSMARPPSGIVGGYESRQLDTPISQPGAASTPYTMHSPSM